MSFQLNKTISVLERTPDVICALLKDQSSEITHSNEGENTWNSFDIVGHLVHGEKTDWISRLEIILSDQDNKSFEPFDRFAQENDSIGKTVNQLVEEFTSLRKKNIEILKSKNLQEADFEKIGEHPALGPVTLRNLLAAWMAHDLSHIAQLTRVMAKHYKLEVGPWVEYMGILK